MNIKKEFQDACKEANIPFVEVTPTPAESKLIASYAPILKGIRQVNPDVLQAEEIAALRADNARLRQELLAIANTCEHFKSQPGFASLAQAARGALGL